MAEIAYTPDPRPPNWNGIPSQNLGGGSGSGVLQVFEGRAPAAPDDTMKAALSFETGGGTLLQWSVGAQAWV